MGTLANEPTTADPEETPGRAEPRPGAGGAPVASPTVVDGSSGRPGGPEAREAPPATLRAREGLSGLLRLSLGVVLVAVAAAVFAVAFRASLAFVLHHLAAAPDVVTAMRAAPWWVRLLLPALGGLVAGALGLVRPGRGGHGLGEVMESVVLGRGRLSMRTTLLKSVRSWAAIATGGSLGREGPLIQFGGAAGQLVADKLATSEARARVLIAAGIAAGFASAYNTPFAASLFVLEVVTGVVVLDAVVPVLVAVAIATAVTRALAGDGPIYGARVFALRSNLELVAFGALGLLGALVGQAFMRLLSAGEGWFRRGSPSRPARAALGGLVAGALVMLLPEVAGNGYEPLGAMLDGRLTLGVVAFLVVAKAVATTASVASGSPGGVFTPTMLLGGGVGLLLGSALHAIFGAAVGPAGGYALVGMAATTAATTHAPLMAAVLAFELSGDYAIALPLLVATGIATALSRRLRRDSIYTAELRARGVSWELSLEKGRVLD